MTPGGGHRPGPHVEDGVRYYRWLSLKEGGFAYPDTILAEDGSTETIHRYAEGGVSPDGEGRWAILSQRERPHVRRGHEHAADGRPGLGRYED